ncbi:MAG: TfoX/Sxy family protein [Paracoccaceae bacterium]
MPLTDADIAFALELFSPLGAITHRRMMGGLAIYHAGQIFASLDRDGRIYLKAKGDFAAQLAAEGAEQFVAGPGKTMGYWSLPDAALDDPDTACAWARRALQAL